MRGTLLKIAAVFTLAGIAIGALVSRLMTPQQFLQSWAVTALVLVFCFAGLFLLWRKAGSARLLGWMIGVAFLLRLALGVGLMQLLPAFGYDTDQQNAGFVYTDPYRREMQAVDLARSDTPIYEVLTGKYPTDRYGGYLALSVFMHRVVGGGEYFPQLMLILSAFAAAAGLPFLWLALDLLRRPGWRKFAGWGYVFFPQAVLLGSTQMREPYLIALVAVVFWAGLEWQQHGLKNAWYWLAAALVAMLLISPGIAVMVVLVTGVWIWLDSSRRALPWWIIPIVFLVVSLGVVAFAYGVARGQHFAKDSPFEVLRNWFVNSAEWDFSLTKGASGQLTYQLQSLPEWVQILFILVYGILQPVLPAAIMDQAAPIWSVINIYLALGWNLMLPVLAYGTAAVFFEKEVRGRLKVLWLAGVTWFWILLCSARAGGDQWDNPRYRTILLVFLLIFCAWSWDHAKVKRLRWFRRVCLVMAIYIGFFMQWYAARIYGVTHKLPFYVMLGLILAASAVVIVGGWVIDLIRDKQVGTTGFRHNDNGDQS